MQQSRLMALVGGTAAAMMILAHPARADTYVYDQSGRLTCVVFSAGGHVAYTYDAAGNRTVHADSTSSTCP